jgi:hypothetical protein
MKALGITSTAVLSLLLAVAAPAWAQEQHEPDQKDRPAQQEEKKAQPKNSAKQEEKPAAQQDKTPKPQERNAQQQDKTPKPQERSAQQPENNAKPEGNNAKPEDNNARQHPAQVQPEKQAQHAGGGRIPDDRFKANFGQEHRFRVSRGDYDRDRHFQYGGYSFGFVDAWPSEWLYTQDVYVVEIDGVYYLCNPAYPGVNITLSVAL